MTDQQKVREAIAELIAADIEYDKARSEWWDGERYDQDSYGVHGSEFYICRSCENESGAGVLNKGVSHEPDCKVAALERAEERRKAALAHASSATVKETLTAHVAGSAAVDSFIERCARVISGAPFPSTRTYAKAREICELALELCTHPAPSAEDARDAAAMPIVSDIEAGVAPIARVDFSPDIPRIVWFKKVSQKIGELDVYTRPVSSSEDARDAERLRFISDEQCTLRVVDIPIPLSSDAETVWEVVDYYMSEPKERIIGTGSTPQEAIDQALAAERGEK